MVDGFQEEGVVNVAGDDGRARVASFLPATAEIQTEPPLDFVRVGVALEAVFFKDREDLAGEDVPAGGSLHPGLDGG